MFQFKLLNMKKLFLFAITIAMLATSSCKKDCPEAVTTVAPNYTGKWVGKYGSSLPGTSDYTIFLNANGELGVISGLGTTPEALGTYTIVGGNTLRGTYKFLSGAALTFSIQATISGTTISNGTYGPNSAISGGGVFQMTKQ
jgi:hypothetical protein